MEIGRAVQRRRGGCRRRLWVLAGLAAGLYIAWCVMFASLQDRTVFARQFAPESLPDPYGAAAVELTIDYDDDGHGYAWYLPAPGASADNPAPAVIFFHGNAEIADYQHDLVAGYHALGCSVLIPEYRGYGRAGGTPSEKAVVADAERFYDLLVERPEVDASRVFFHGRSLGGGCAAGLAARRTPAGLILESTFTSVVAMARGYLLPAFLVRHPFRTDRVLKRLEAPVLIFHGTQDGVVPVAHGRKLATLARHGRYVEYDCGHIDVSTEPGYWDELRRFLHE